MKYPTLSKHNVYLPVAGGRALYHFDHRGIVFIDCFKFHSMWNEASITQDIHDAHIPDKIIPFNIKLK